MLSSNLMFFQPFSWSECGMCSVRKMKAKSRGPIYIYQKKRLQSIGSRVQRMSYCFPEDGPNIHKWRKLSITADSNENPTHTLTRTHNDTNGEHISTDWMCIFAAYIYIVCIVCVRVYVLLSYALVRVSRFAEN